MSRFFVQGRPSIQSLLNCNSSVGSEMSEIVFSMMCKPIRTEDLQREQKDRVGD